MAQTEEAIQYEATAYFPDRLANIAAACVDDPDDPRLDAICQRLSGVSRAWDAARSASVQDQAAPITADVGQDLEIVAPSIVADPEEIRDLARLSVADGRVDRQQAAFDCMAMQDQVRDIHGIVHATPDEQRAMAAIQDEFIQRTDNRVHFAVALSTDQDRLDPDVFVDRLADMGCRIERDPLHGQWVVRDMATTHGVDLWRMQDSERQAVVSHLDRNEEGMPQHEMGKLAARARLGTALERVGFQPAVRLSDMAAKADERLEVAAGTTSGRAGIETSQRHADAVLDAMAGRDEQAEVAARVRRAWDAASRKSNGRPTANSLSEGMRVNGLDARPDEGGISLHIGLSRGHRGRDLGLSPEQQTVLAAVGGTRPPTLAEKLGMRARGAWDALRGVESGPRRAWELETQGEDLAEVRERAGRAWQQASEAAAQRKPVDPDLADVQGRASRAYDRAGADFADSAGRPRPTLADLRFYLQKESIALEMGERGFVFHDLKKDRMWPIEQVVTDPERVEHLQRLLLPGQRDQVQGQAQRPPVVHQGR